MRSLGFKVQAKNPRSRVQVATIWPGAMAIVLGARSKVSGLCLSGGLDSSGASSCQRRDPAQQLSMVERT